MKRRISGSLLLIVCISLVACAGAQLTPEGILYKAESLYLAQRIDYLTNFDYNAETKKYTPKPDLTEEQKDILRMREDALNKFKGAIDTYRSFVKAGVTPSVEAEQALIALIRKYSGGE